MYYSFLLITVMLGLLFLPLLFWIISKMWSSKFTLKDFILILLNKDIQIGFFDGLKYCLAWGIAGNCFSVLFTLFLSKVINYIGFPHLIYLSYGFVSAFWVGGVLALILGLIGRKLAFAIWFISYALYFNRLYVTYMDLLKVIS